MNKLSALHKIKKYFESTDQFAFDPKTGSCEYLASNKKMCPIGVISPDAKTMPANSISVLISDYNNGFLNSKNPNYHFIGDLAKDSPNLWNKIQTKHDLIAEDVATEALSFEEGKKDFLQFIDDLIATLGLE